MLFNILKIRPIFSDYVIRYRFSMLFDAGSSIFRNRFWVHIRCQFDILKYRAALVHTAVFVNIDGHFAISINALSKHRQKVYIKCFLLTLETPPGVFH